MKYIKEDIENMLKEHLKNEAKLTEIKLKLDEYKERLEYAGTVYQDTENEIIESMQLSGQAMSDIPKSASNKVSDTTYNTAINYPREAVHINKDDRVFLERKIQELENEEKRLGKIIERVKNLLNQASIEERFILKEYYMQKSKWDYVYTEYFKEFNKYKSIGQLQNIRDEALVSMLEVINIGI